MEEIIPKWKINDLDKTLILNVIKLWKKLDNYKLLDCKLAILECISKIKELDFNRFICSTNNEVYESFTTFDQITLPGVITLVIVPEEVIIFNTESNKEVDSISFPFIMGWGYHEQGISIIASKELKEATLNFNTKQGAIIDFLLKGYSRILAKKDIRGLKNQKPDEAFLPYKVRDSLEYIEKQRAGYQLKYDLI